MVLIKRRPVDMVPPPDPAMHDADAEAFYLAETGEVFLDYECVELTRRDESDTVGHCDAFCYVARLQACPRAAEQSCAP
jgi:hypothetical protein